MLLIDGHNLWHAAMGCGEPLSGIARRGFVRVLDRFAQAGGQRAVVVLDGHRPSAAAARTELRGGAEQVYADARSGLCPDGPGAIMVHRPVLWHVTTRITAVFVPRIDKEGRL